MRNNFSGGIYFPAGQMIAGKKTAMDDKENRI